MPFLVSGTSTVVDPFVHGTDLSRAYLAPDFHVRKAASARPMAIGPTGAPAFNNSATVKMQAPTKNLHRSVTLFLLLVRVHAHRSESDSSGERV